MKQWVMGIDGGGTQTRAIVRQAKGDSAGQGIAGPCNLAAVSLPEALAAALMAADEALRHANLQRENIGALCAGVAGASFTERRAEFTQGLRMAFPHAKVAVEPDYAIALTGAHGGKPGMIVIAGTGSAAYGENEAGESHKTGAYGYLIYDAGSGYGVGRAALSAVLRAADGTGEATQLTDHILAALSLVTVAGIVPGVYGGTVSRVMIASLSRIVADAAEDHDAVASAILMRAGGALAQLAQGVTSRLFPASDAPCPVALIGGLWHSGPTLTDVFTRSLMRFAPHTVITAPLQSPVEGAAMRAAQLLEGF